MKELTVSQEYLLCALTESGKLPALSYEAPVCLVAGGLIDLIFAQSVAVDGKEKLCIASELAPRYQHLASLYGFIKESKPMKVENLSSEYAFTFSDKRIKQLLHDIGTSLAALGCVSPEAGGLLGGTACFVPDKDQVDHVIQNIRAELLEDGTVSDQMIALVSLLEKSNQIKRYFSKYEKDQLKTRLKEIQSTDSHKLIKKMTDYIDTMVAIIAATGAAH